MAFGRRTSLFKRVTGGRGAFEAAAIRRHAKRSIASRTIQTAYRNVKKARVRRALYGSYKRGRSY